MTFLRFAYYYLGLWTVAPLFRRIMRNPDLFSLINYGKIIICHPKQREFGGFNECSLLALQLIEISHPRLYSVISEELDYIVGQSDKQNVLASYNRAMRMSSIYWKNMKQYRKPTQIKFMAGALIHEAYHGKCYRIFGDKVYFSTKKVERVCRNREIRFLKKISTNSDLNADEAINIRIEMLSSPIT